MDRVAHVPLINVYSGCLIFIVLLIIFLLWLFNPRASVKSINLVYPLRPLPLGNGLNSRELVEDQVTALAEGFKPSWWLPNGHAQTLYSALADFSEDDPIEYERHLLRLPDGGTIGVDICPPLSMKLPADAPLVVINHGLTGGSHESYVRNIVTHVSKPWSDGGIGARAAVINFRGCNNTPITSPHLYSSGTTLDTHTATTYLSHLFPHAAFFGVGFSLGAAVMTRYLGEQGNKCRLRAATVLCAPLELREMSAKLDSRHFFPKLYSYSMARKMLRSLIPHLVPDSILSSPESPLQPHIPALLSMAGRYKWTLRASHVTEMVVAKIGGSGDHFPFAGLQQFLEWACPGAWLGRIKRPTLAISATDDPIVSGECLPHELIRNSTHVVLAEVPHGGHLGWFDGPLSGPNRHRRWHVRPVLQFLRAAAELPWTDIPPPVVIEEEDGWCWVGNVGWRLENKQAT